MFLKNWTESFLFEEAPGAGGGGGGSGTPPAAPPTSLLGAPAPTPPVAAPPAGTPPAAPAGEFKWPENWRDGIDPTLKDDPTIKALPDVNSAFKMLLSAQKMVGADKVVKPGKHATKEDWRTFYNQVGLPANLQDYKLELPKDSGLDDGFVGKVREQAFNIGIMPSQLNELLGWYSEANKSAVTQMNEQYKTKIETGIGNLRKEWGEAFKDRVEVARRALNYAGEKTGIQNVKEWLDTTGVGDDPNMVKLLHFMGGFLKENGIIGEDSVPQGQTPNDMQSEVNTIMGDFKGPYYDKSHPNHKASVDHVAKLMASLHPVSSQQRV